MGGSCQRGKCCLRMQSHLKFKSSNYLDKWAPKRPYWKFPYHEDVLDLFDPSDSLDSRFCSCFFTDVVTLTGLESDFLEDLDQSRHNCWKMAKKTSMTNER